ADGVDGIGAGSGAFEAGNDDPRMAGNLARRGHALAKVRQLARLLERIARTDEPPNLIEPEPLYGGEADLAGALMGWIERAAEETNAHMGGRHRHPQVRGGRPSPLASLGAQGRIWPEPCTMYLKLVSCSTPTGPRA